MSAKRTLALVAVAAFLAASVADAASVRVTARSRSRGSQASSRSRSGGGRSSAHSRTASRTRTVSRTVSRTKSRGSSIALSVRSPRRSSSGIRSSRGIYGSSGGLYSSSRHRRNSGLSGGIYYSSGSRRSDGTHAYFGGSGLRLRVSGGDRRDGFYYHGGVRYRYKHGRHHGYRRRSYVYYWPSAYGAYWGPTNYETLVVTDRPNITYQPVVYQPYAVPYGTWEAAPEDEPAAEAGALVEVDEPKPAPAAEDRPFDSPLSAMLGGPGRAGAAFALGETMLSSGRYQQAAVAFRHSLGRDDDATVRVALALALTADGQYENAAYMLRRALAEMPDPGAIRLDLTTTYGDGFAAEAVAARLQEAARADPDNAGLQLLLGFLHVLADETEEAADALRRARRLAPDDDVIAALMPDVPLPGDPTLSEAAASPRETALLKDAVPQAQAPETGTEEG